MRLERPQWKQIAQILPGEADIGPDACEMHGIAGGKIMGEELLRPAVGIIVDPHQSRRCAAGQTRMMNERDVIKSKLARRLQEQAPEVRVASASIGLLLEDVDQS